MGGWVEVKNKRLFWVRGTYILLEKGLEPLSNVAKQGIYTFTCLCPILLVSYTLSSLVSKSATPFNPETQKPKGARPETERMATSTARVSFRVIVAILLILLLFYVGRPLYWKISATVHEIRQNKQTVKQGCLSLSSDSSSVRPRFHINLSCFGLNLWFLSSGISQFVFEAQKSVGWFHDESDSGLREDRNAAAAANRKILRQVL